MEIFNKIMVLSSVMFSMIHIAHASDAHKKDNVAEKPVVEESKIAFDSLEMTGHAYDFDKMIQNISATNKPVAISTQKNGINIAAFNTSLFSSRLPSNLYNDSTTDPSIKKVISKMDLTVASSQAFIDNKLTAPFETSNPYDLWEHFFGSKGKNYTGYVKVHYDPKTSNFVTSVNIKGDNNEENTLTFTAGEQNSILIGLGHKTLILAKLEKITPPSLDKSEEIEWETLTSGDQQVQLPVMVHTYNSKPVSQPSPDNTSHK